MKKLLLALLLVGLLGLGTALAQDPGDGFIFGDALPTAPELAARGEFGVGVTTMSFTNPEQVDILNISEDNPEAVYDRELTVEVWYPAMIPDGAEELVEYEDALGRADFDNVRPFTFQGRALRDAEADASGGPYPLVIVSHGFPGSRLMMTYLTENLASKGYVVAAIGHTESTFQDVGSFGSTLLNRTFDQVFVLNQMAALPEDSMVPADMVDADNTGLVGYSMGGYGALSTLGAGYNEIFANVIGPLAGLVAEGSDSHNALRDERIKAAVLFAPWGGDLSAFGLQGQALWSDEALADITTPTFWITGSRDDVAYFSGIENLYNKAVNSERYLLVYENALHNVAPNPPPAGIEALSDYERYADPTWDERHINNVNQHFITAFLGQHLKGQDNAAYLSLEAEVSNDGVFAVDEDGEFTEDHTYWTGFAPRTALGMELRFSTPE